MNERIFSTIINMLAQAENEEERRKIVICLNILYKIEDTTIRMPEIKIIE